LVGITVVVIAISYARCMPACKRWFPPAASRSVMSSWLCAVSLPISLSPYAQQG